jgi:hypothetical protein
VTEPQSERRPTWIERRQAKIAAEIQRSRRGGHKVPTWVMAVALVVIVGAWVTLIVLS